VARPRARRPRAVALVRCGKGNKSRRQPLPASLARELRRLRAARQPEPTDPVFCGLEGGRLQETILADIIRRAATRASIEKHVTAHTLRHTAATWLRQELGDTRLVAEYLGHDLFAEYGCEILGPPLSFNDLP
jgi:integrase/recombinase XerD